MKSPYERGFFYFRTHVSTHDPQLQLSPVFRLHMIDSEAHNAVTAFLRLPAVMAATGMTHTTIYDWVKAGRFPKPLQIGARAMAWDEAEVAAWQQSLAHGFKTAAV